MTTIFRTSLPIIALLAHACSGGASQVDSESDLRLRCHSKSCLVTTLPTPSGPGVLMDEILFMPTNAGALLETSQWIELYNRGASGRALLGWTFKNRQGQTAALPAVVLPPQARLVVVFAGPQRSTTDELDFSDGEGIFHLPLANFLSGTQEALTLADQNGAIVDFVAWQDPTQTPQPWPISYAQAVLGGHWRSGDHFSTQLRVRGRGKTHRVAAGDSIGRSADSEDTGSARDWFTKGGCDSGEPTPSKKNETNVVVQSEVGAGELQAKKWLVLIYSAADNDLQHALLSDLNEIEAGLAGAQAGAIDAHFVAQFEGLQGWGVHRGLLQADQDDKKVTFRKLAGQADLQGEVDMSDPASLSAFITWATSAYAGKYDKRALIISSHGDGWKGVIEDGGFADMSAATSTESEANFMVMHELRSAINTTFDVIAFDACNMGEVEVAYQLRDKGRGGDAAIVLSQLTVPADGFNYQALVQNISTAGSGAALATRIVQDYGAKYKSRSLAAFKLGAPINALYDELDQFAKDMGSDKPTRNPAKQSGLDDHQGTSNPGDDVILRVKVQREDSALIGDAVDIADFMQNISDDALIPPTNKGRAGEIRSKLSAARIALSNKSAHQLNGLSIYFPKSQESLTKSDDEEPFNDSGAYESYNSYTIVKYGPDDRPSHLWDAADQPVDDNPGFLFAANEWVHFLHRYFEPVAKATCRAWGRSANAICHANGSTTAVGKLTDMIWDTAPAANTDDNDADRDGIQESDDDTDATGAYLLLPLEGRPALSPVVLTVYNDMHLRGPDAGQAREADQDQTLVQRAFIRETFTPKPRGTLGDARLNITNSTSTKLRNVRIRSRHRSGRLQIAGASVRSDQRGHQLVFATTQDSGLESWTELTLTHDIEPGETMTVEFSVEAGASFAISEPLHMDVVVADMPNVSASIDARPSPPVLVDTIVPLNDRPAQDEQTLDLGTGPKLGGLRF